MDKQLIFIPVILVLLAIIGVSVQVIMMKRGKKSVGKAREAMLAFVREQLPHMSGAALDVIETKPIADLSGEGQQWVIAYNDEDLFFIPATSNPYTQKIKRVKEDPIDTVPVTAITEAEVNEEKRIVRLAVRGTKKTFYFLKTDMFGADHAEDLERFFAFVRRRLMK